MVPYLRGWGWPRGAATLLTPPLLLALPYKTSLPIAVPVAAAAAHTSPSLGFTSTLLYLLRLPVPPLLDPS